MHRINLRHVALSLICAGFVLNAQDADLALRTSVSYRTQRASRPLTEEQRKEADRLSVLATQAAQSGKYGEAMRDYNHGFAVMQGAEWTPALELATSLQAGVDHSMVAPGQNVTFSLRPLYLLEQPLQGPVTESIVIRPVKQGTGPEKVLLPGQAIDPKALPATAQFPVPELAAGDYVIEARLATSTGAIPEPARTSFVKTLPVHVEALSADAEHLRARLAKGTARNASALPTAEYALALYERADRGEINPSRYNFHQEFATANAILDSLDAGKDPFASQRGDSRRAYRSTADRELQPYRLFVPDQYDGTKPTPLIVALHGMGGDENSMFDGYDGNVKREAARLGFLVVAPKGRKPASMYRGPAEKDVLDVLAEVERDYKVDRNRVYLMGHSMGGYGTWSVAMDYPDIWAALGPISGGGDASGMAKIKNIPQYVVHGDDDRTVPVTQSRTMVAAGKSAGAVNIKYVEIPGGSHISVAAPQIAPMFDFFAQQHKGETAVSATASR